MVKTEPNKVTAVLKVVVTGEFYDDEATEEMLRYCVEQDLDDAGFDVDVSVVKEKPNGEWIPCRSSIHPYGNDVKCSVCGHQMGSSFGYKFCPMCGADMT